MDLITNHNLDDIIENNKKLIENIKISQKLFIPWFHLLTEKSKNYLKVNDITKLIDSNTNYEINDETENQLVIKNTKNYIENINKLRKGDIVSLFDKKNNTILIFRITSEIQYSEIEKIKIISRLNKKCIHKKFNSECFHCLDNIITITNSFNVHQYINDNVIIEKYYSIYKEIEIIEELDSLTIEILSKHYQDFPKGIKNSKIIIEI